MVCELGAHRFHRERPMTGVELEVEVLVLFERLPAGGLRPPQIGPELRHFFRDVNDHLKLVDDEVVAQRDLLAVILQANMAVVSVAQNEIAVRQNETAKQLTVIATIFLPLTFITGFFGQNFGWLTSHIDNFWDFAVLGIGLMAIAAATLWVWIRRYEL